MNSVSNLSKPVLALVAAGASAGTILMTFLPEKEGLELKAYLDGSRVWTKCYGETSNVTPNMVYPKAECDALLRSRVGQSIAEIKSMVTVPMSEPQLAAVASFCSYNLGMAKCKGTSFMRKLNAGDKVGACHEIKRWIFDGGRDCRIKANNCAGQVLRRDQEAELCAL